MTPPLTWLPSRIGRLYAIWVAGGHWRDRAGRRRRWLGSIEDYGRLAAHIRAEHIDDDTTET